MYNVKMKVCQHKTIKGHSSQAKKKERKKKK